MGEFHQPIREWPERERPREQMLRNGARSLTEAALIAVLFRTGTKGHTALDLARSILTAHGGLSGLARADATALASLGIGPVRASVLLAALELGRRVASERGDEEVKVAGPEDVARRYGPLMRDLSHEEFWVLHLNAANRLQSEVRVTKGTLNASLAHPRECFADAIVKRAASVIFVHNHPSGNPEPSREDIELTRQLVEAGRILGIPVHDHIIIAGKSFTSLADRRLL